MVISFFFYSSAFLFPKKQLYSLFFCWKNSFRQKMKQPKKYMTKGIVHLLRKLLIFIVLALYDNSFILFFFFLFLFLSLSPHIMFSVVCGSIVELYLTGSANAFQSLLAHMSGVKLNKNHA